MIALAQENLSESVSGMRRYSLTRNVSNPLHLLKSKVLKNESVAPTLYNNRPLEFEAPGRHEIPKRYLTHHTPKRSKNITKNSELKYQFNNYMQDIKDCTGRAVSKEQQDLLKDYIETTPIKKLSVQEMKEHRHDFTLKRTEIRREWAFRNQQDWPQYQTNVIINGKVDRQAGNFYDAHHIIENCYGGPNVWWNMHPARYPEQHQGGIHRDEGVCSKLFGKIKNYHISKTN